MECSPTNDKSELPAPVRGNFKSSICNVMEQSTQVIPSEGFFFRERKMVDRIGAGCFRQGAESRRETNKQGYIKMSSNSAQAFPPTLFPQFPPLDGNFSICQMTDFIVAPRGPV